ncbi:protein FAM32A [Pectinophora gossypiella]|uniref:protein FAM32A n=1 Tax=Pectinophora gossypiella TaxID=13191 RepID=UPI00214ECD67|nr:protein FAM32A [Pectinophora gossypiella]
MGEEDEYACVNKAQLKIKDTSGIKKKKKKKSSKDKEKLIESEIKEQIKEQIKQQGPQDKRTKAEIAFQRMQEKMQKQRIQQKAEMTHKQRVEKFNQHLDSLTEHFDIPKVSWTK